MASNIDLARSAYLLALDSPDTASDWRAIAGALFACLPPPKKAARAPDSRFTPYLSRPRSFYQKKSMKDYDCRLAEITFVDGVTIRAYAIAPPNKPYDIGTAVRAAYQKRGFRGLPDCRQITACAFADGSAIYSPTEASAELAA
jgi:hypothetical protein